MFGRTAVEMNDAVVSPGHDALVAVNPRVRAA
jgi:hypothetical protein